MVKLFHDGVRKQGTVYPPLRTVRNSRRDLSLGVILLLLPIVRVKWRSAGIVYHVAVELKTFAFSVIKQARKENYRSNVFFSIPREYVLPLYFGYYSIH